METVYSFKGQGGKEKIYEIFANDILKLPLKRQSHKLYDFVNLENDQKIEFKKQCNQQWFDASKYYNLSDNDMSSPPDGDINPFSFKAFLSTVGNSNVNSRSSIINSSSNNSFANLNENY